MAKIKQDIVKLQEEYAVSKRKFDDLRDELTRQISTLISKSNIYLAVPVQNRTKSWVSINDKITQKRFTIKSSLFEMQDIVGLRIILLFKKDVQTCVDLIRSNFKIISQYNTEDKLEDNQFGYLSIHQIIELSEDWLRVPTLAEYANIKSEIQIRTLSQHAWAEVSQIFQYKNEDNVPKPLKRSISRISALLETVDLEFERVLLERQAYKREISETKNNPKSQEHLNVDILIKILDEKLPIQNKEPEGKDEEYSELLENLKLLGFNTISDLFTLIDQNYGKALKEDKAEAKNIIENESVFLDANEKSRAEKGVFYNHTGLIRVMLNHHLGKPWWTVINEK